MKQFSIQVADISFTFKAANTILLLLDENHKPFSVQNPGSDAINITVDKGVPENFGQYEPLFTAPGYIEETKEFTNKRLWSIVRIDDRDWIVSWNQERNFKCEIAATSDGDYKNWTILANPDYYVSETVNPCTYPIFLLILFYVLTKNQGIMVHASGIDDGEKCRVFSGFSGVGKSTTSRLWFQSGARIVNDDRLIIRKIGDELKVFNSPMLYPTAPSFMSLDEIFLIRHSDVNEAKKLPKIVGLTHFMAFCIQQDYKKELVDHLLFMLQEITRKVPVYDLGFLPDQRIVQFIKADEHLR
jgi:hypothetical protein